MPNWTTNTIELRSRSVEEMDTFLAAVKSEASPFDFERIVPMPEDLRIICGSVTDDAARLALYLQYGSKTIKYPAKYRLELQLPLSYSFDSTRIDRYIASYGMDKDEATALMDRCSAAVVQGRENLKECISVEPSAYLDYHDPKSFEAFIALGFHMLDNVDNYGYTTWYDWAYAKWGTKWNACEASVDRYAGVYCNIRFDTAWCAPIPVFEALAKQYPDMEITAWWIDEEDWCLQDNDPEFTSGTWQNN